MPISVTITDIVIDRMFLMQQSDPVTDALQWVIQAVYTQVDASGNRYSQRSRIIPIPSQYQTYAQTIHDKVHDAIIQMDGI